MSWWPFRTPPHVRGLFAYHDGRHKRLGDPLEIDARLRHHGGDHWADLLSVLSAAETPVPAGSKFAQVVAAQQEEAVRGLAELSRKAFALRPLTDDGRGLSVAESLNVLAAYLSFLASLKERWGPLPNLPARPASPSPEGPGTGEWSPSGSPSPESAGAGPTS